MKRRYTKDDWRRAVFADKYISDGTKVLLLYLADHMGEDLRVSVSRSRIARDLGVSERRISDRFREAVGDLRPVRHRPEDDAETKAAREKLRLARSAELKARRLLDRRARGQKHRQAEYVGLPPDADSQQDTGRHPERSQDAATPPAEIARKRPAENAALSVNHNSQQDTGRPALLQRNVPDVVTNRNGGNDEEGRQTAPTCRHGVEHGTEPDPWEAGALVCAACDRDQSEREAAL